MTASRSEKSGSAGQFSTSDRHLSWTPQEVKEVLGAETGQLFCDVYHITPQGNFEGHSIPNLIHSPLATKESEQLKATLHEAREKLFTHREKRIHPGKDDKILTAWNGLMIAALAKAGRVLNDPAYLQAAEKAVHFINEQLRNEKGRLLARYRAGEAAYLGYVDDYAFLIWGLLEMYETTQEVEYLAQALRDNDDLLHYFWDDQDGGLFFYGSDGEQLIARPKEIYDGATPSGNGVSAHNFLRLFYLTGRLDLRGKAEKLLEAFAGGIQHYPAGYSFSLMAIQLLTSPVKQIVIAGEKADPQVESFLQASRTGYQPFRFVQLHDPTGKLASIAESVADKDLVNGKSAAYVCENFSCRAPVTDPAELHSQL